MSIDSSHMLWSVTDTRAAGASIIVCSAISVPFDGCSWQRDSARLTTLIGTRRP